MKRRTELIGIFPNEDAIAILLEQNDKWVVQGTAIMILETIAPLSNDGSGLPAFAG